MATQATGATGEQGIRVASRTVRIAGSAPDAPKLPGELRLLPWGAVRSTNGDFIVDEESANAVLEAFRAQGTDLVIDYEHQSLGGRYAAPSGLAPAAGWVTELEVRANQGIWGKVRWTLNAARRILRQEYRFLSPVVIIRKDDRKVMSLDSVALTNRPAIAGMQPVVNRRQVRTNDQAGQGKGTGHGSQGIANERGQAHNVCTGRKAQAQAKEERMQEELRQLRQLLALDEQAGDQEVVRQACGRLAELTEAARQHEASQRVVCAMQAGKVTEAQKEWARQYALRDPAGFDGWLKDAPVLVPLQQATVHSREPAGEPNSRRQAVIAAARGEYRSNPLLQQLTGERAYINEALQQAGMEGLRAED